MTDVLVPVQSEQLNSNFPLRLHNNFQVSENSKMAVTNNKNGHETIKTSTDKEEKVRKPEEDLERDKQRKEK